MSTETLTAIVTLLVALSVASERLVEIIKGFVSWLNEEQKTADGKTDNRREGYRKAVLQILAVLAGIFTAWIAQPAIEAADIQGLDGFWGILALGLLASGGSGFWNSVLTYVKTVKDLNKELG